MLVASDKLGGALVPETWQALSLWEVVQSQDGTRESVYIYTYMYTVYISENQNDGAKKNARRAIPQDGGLDSQNGGRTIAVGSHRSTRWRPVDERWQVCSYDDA